MGSSLSLSLSLAAGPDVSVIGSSAAAAAGFVRFFATSVVSEMPRLRRDDAEAVDTGGARRTVPLQVVRASVGGAGIGTGGDGGDGWWVLRSMMVEQNKEHTCTLFVDDHVVT